MGSTNVESDANRTDPVLAALSSHRRRSVLSALQAESAALELDPLAARVAADLDGVTPEAVGADRRETVRAALHHRDLPKLAEAGLVAWDPADEVAGTTDHPALTDRHVRELLDAADPDLDAVLDALANRRRRVALSVLVDHGDAIASRDLARRTAARERGVSPGEVAPDAVDDVVASLHHLHLPKLAEADLLVDDGPAAVRYEGHPRLDDGLLGALEEPSAPITSVAP